MINVLIPIFEITKGMKSIGNKSLLNIKNSVSILEYQINCVRSLIHGAKITLITGFDHHKVGAFLNTKKYNNVDILYNKEYNVTNEAYGVKLYLEKYKHIENLLIINGGVLFKHDCVWFDKLQKKSKIFVLDKQKENFTLGCTTSTKLEYLFYDLPQPWSECAYLSSDTIDILKDIVKKKHINQMFLFELINNILFHNIAFEKQIIKKKNIMKIINQKDLKKAKLFI